MIDCLACKMLEIITLYIKILMSSDFVNTVEAIFNVCVYLDSLEGILPALMWLIVCVFS